MNPVCVESLPQMSAPGLDPRNEILQGTAKKVPPQPKHALLLECPVQDCLAFECTALRNELMRAATDCASERLAEGFPRAWLSILV